MSGGHFAGILTPLTCRGSKGAHNVQWTLALCGPEQSGDVPSGKFRNSPKAGSGAEWLATLRNLPVISPPLNRHHLSNFIPTVLSPPKYRWRWFCDAGTDCGRKRKSPHSIDFFFLKQAGHAPLRCEVSDNHVPYPALYSFLRLACSIPPSANAFLLYFPVFSCYFCLSFSGSLSISAKRHKNSSHKHFSNS